MFLAIVISMVLLGSIIFAAPSSNATICIVVVLGIQYIGQYLAKIAIQQAEPMRTILYFTYFVIPHLEWFYLHDSIVFPKNGLADWGAVAEASIYAMFYTGAFLVATWVCFRRKPLSQ
jgi:ABC-type transport system involved in multi-copper enzyme maturation permease subunit